jgi:hypothetical protein
VGKMSGNGTSEVFGGLVPSPPAEPQDNAGDDEFDSILQTLFVQVLPLQGNAVFTRWQLEPPAQPPATTDWCSIGTTVETEIGTGYTSFYSEDGLSYEKLEQLVSLETSVIFYGPHAMAYGAILRDAWQIAQNRDLLREYNLGFTLVIGPQRMPEVINGQNVNRADLTIVLQRTVIRLYNVQPLVSFAPVLDSGSITSTLSINLGG